MENSMTHCVASKEDLDFAKENAAIVHFPGMAKPWKFNDIHFSDEWMAVFRRCQGDDADLDRVSYFGLKSMIEGAVKPAAPLECLVSVVIPAFNSAPTLPRCLDSIIPQLDERMELIVVDDGSSDGSFSMLMEKYGHNPLVRLARTTVNRGAVFARNDAIRLSRGRFIAFCDADDEWLPGKLFEQLSVMENDPATDIVFIQDVNVVEDGSGGSRRIHQMSLKDNTFHLRSCLVRKSVFERIGLLDETLTMRDDTEWIVRAVSTDSKYFVVDKELDVRHISSSGLSVKTLLNEKEKGRKRFEAFARGLRRRYFENSPIYDLSVLIPCMNASEYIAEAIKSC
ncbi:MAG: glycosyltransferase family 2 protein, partial [Bacteroidales bacterium]|nr:glycosyltransferase family 2 protein [Bacteroidales bacterium]